MQILIYTEKATPRFTYVLDELLKERMGLKYEVVTDKQDYLQSFLPGICYGRARVRKGNEIYIPAAGLVLENEVKEIVPEVSVFENIPVLFPVHENGDLPFDIFSAVFYMLSRYEEYLPFEQDEHGRFPAALSLAHRKDFLEVPVVDSWALILEKKLITVFPGLSFREKEYRFLPTFDVDQVFAVQDKPVMRFLGGSLKAGDFAARWKIRRGRTKDPFDTFALIRRLHEPTGLKPFFFFHTGKWGKFDKSISPEKESVRQVIRECNTWGRVGLHPSYRSHDEPELLRWEKERLEKVLGCTVTASRQHFIRLRLPETYRRFLEVGIREDYSMGFPELPGFRAGTSRPFRWFDLQHNETTGLTVYPFAVMDGALKKKYGSKGEEVLRSLSILQQKIENTGGWFVQLWHNHTLSDQDDWQGWKHLYEEWLEKAIHGK